MVSFVNKLCGTKLQLKFLRTALVMLSLLFSASLHAQVGLEVPVKVDVENGKVDDVLIKLMKNGKTIFSQSSVSKLKLRLNFNSNYTIVFTKPGYITKSVEFDTKAPADHIADGFDPYKIGVKLFKQYDGINITVYNQPVGKIRFDKDLDEFNYDTDYSKSILSALKETEEKLQARANEEEKTGITNVAVEDKHTVDSAAAPVAEAVANTTPSSAQITSAPQEDSPPAKPANSGNDVVTKTMGSGGEETNSYLAMEGSNDIGVSTSVSQGNDVGKPKQYHSAADPNVGKLPKQNGNDPGTGTLISEDEKITREDIVEKNRIITLIKVTRGKTTTEYRRVNYRWGGPFYFKNEISSISEDIFVFATGIKD